MSQSRTFKATILAFAQGMATVAGLVIGAVLSRRFDYVDYATFRQTLLVFTVATPFLVMGLPQSLYYFLPTQKEHSRTILLNNLVLLGITGLAFSLFLILGGNWLLSQSFGNEALGKTLLILSPYSLFMIPMAAFAACMVVQNRVKQVAFFTTINRVLALVLVIAAVFIWQTPEAAVAATVVGAGIMFFPGIILMFRSTEGKIRHPSIDGLWEQIKYSVPLGAATMVGKVARSLDRIIVASLCSSEQFAIYTNGATRIPLIAAVTVSVASVLLPDVVRFYKDGKSNDAVRLWQSAAVKCSFIIFPVTCFALAMAPEIIACVYSDKYLKSAGIFRLYTLLLPSQICTWGVLFMAAHKGHWLLVRSIVGLGINLVVSLLLVHLCGPKGAVIGTIITLYAWNIGFNLIGIGKLYQLPISRVLPIKKIAKVFAFSIAASFVFVPELLFGQILPQNNWMRLAVYALLYSTIQIGLFIIFGVVKKDVIRKAVTKILSGRNGKSR
ncbi:MAG: oligosaccharide flippase family protein [Phycisphaerae bacterium]|nr:oligosaccharide flippase family protein [Phycisphaerae bacterium]